jgi:phage/plasmid-associated DNA primase
MTTAICTNDRLITDGNCDGVWRRMREVPFKAKFMGDGEKLSSPAQYVFPKDPTINESKFQKWKHVFITRLVNMAFVLQGRVNVCPQVMEATEQYRLKQNIIATFMLEKVRCCTSGAGSAEDAAAAANVDPSEHMVSKSTLLAEFKKWYATNSTGYANKCNSYHEDLIECMNRTYGTMTKGSRRTGWPGCDIINDDEVFDASMNPI